MDKEGMCFDFFYCYLYDLVGHDANEGVWMTDWFTLCELIRL